MRTRKDREKRVIGVFALCMCFAFFSAFEFAVLLNVSLPKTDMAYVRPIWKALNDPFITGGTIVGGVVFGLGSFPFVLIATRYVPFLTMAALGALVAVVIGLGAMLGGWFGLLAGVCTLASILVACAAGVFDSAEMLEEDDLPAALPATPPRR